MKGQESNNLCNSNTRYKSGLENNSLFFTSKIYIKRQVPRGNRFKEIKEFRIVYKVIESSFPKMSLKFHFRLFDISKVVKFQLLSGFRIVVLSVKII